MAPAAHPAVIPRRGIVVTAAVAAVVAAAACGASAPRQPPVPPVIALVPGPPSAYPAVEIRSGDRTAPVPVAQVAPLLVAREFAPTEPLSAYGLDRPVAQLRYVARSGPDVDVDLGATTFDHHFIYARRAGDPQVGLVAASVAAPMLAAVGVRLPAPT